MICSLIIVGVVDKSIIILSGSSSVKGVVGSDVGGSGGRKRIEEIGVLMAMTRKLGRVSRPYWCVKEKVEMAM